ncbi:MAG: hypothetical protein AAGC47_15950, partial [Bacteroidota bacterium]
KNFKELVMSELTLEEYVDSVFDLSFTIEPQQFVLEYKYQIEHHTGGTKVFDIRPYYFLDNHFYTPYSLRQGRKSKGYLFEESDVRYNISFNFNGEFKWLENELMNSTINNDFGEVNFSYSKGDKLSLTFQLNYLKEKFEPEEWSDILELRDASYDFLNSKLYFEHIGSN